jgi:microcystin degradation protein MlrC
VDLAEDMLEGTSLCMTSDVPQLPVLEVDGQKISQSGSILRLICRLAGKDGDDPILAARADSAFEAAQEMAMAQIYVAVNLMEEAQAKEVASKFKSKLPRYLENWSKLLEDPYFHGV